MLVARRAADAWGILSLDELFACGLSRIEVRGRVRNGRLHPLHRGVYGVGHTNVALEGRLLAAVKACGPDAVLSHCSAAVLWGFMRSGDRHPEATGPAPTPSELEDATLDLMLRGGLAHPDVNVALRLSGRRVVPDFRWPDQRLVVEADGSAWHDNQLAREDDAERQALLEADGERVLHVTWDQVIARPGQTLVRIRPAGAPIHQQNSNMLRTKPIVPGASAR